MASPPNVTPEFLKRKLAEIEGRDLNATGGPPFDSGGDGMEPRIAKLEAHVENIKSDISDIKADLRWIIGGIAGSFLLLSGMIITEYLLIAVKLDKPPQVQVISAPLPLAPKQP